MNKILMLVFILYCLVCGVRGLIILVRKILNMLK